MCGAIQGMIDAAVDAAVSTAVNETIKATCAIMKELQVHTPVEEICRKLDVSKEQVEQTSVSCSVCLQRVVAMTKSPP